MTKDEALDLALAALVLNNSEWKSLADSGDAGFWSAEEQEHYKQTEEAITAIKQARLAPYVATPLVQEPVAWMSKHDVGFIKSEFGATPTVPLYTTPSAQPAPAPGYCKHCKQYTIEEPLPAAQRQWVGLTDEEIEKLTVELRDIPVTLAFAIEAKLKERNK